MTISTFKLLLFLLLTTLLLAQAAPIPRSTSLWSDFFRCLSLRGCRARPEPFSHSTLLPPRLPELDLGPKFDSYDITTSYEQLANPWAYSEDAPFADFSKRGLNDAGL